MQNARDLLRETEAKRLDLLSAIGKKRNSAVIAYLTSTRPGVGGFMSMDDLLIIEPHVRAARDQGLNNLDLILVTFGGAAVAPWDIVAMIREYIGGVLRVILPSVAYSAGTMISLGADEIVMGPGSIIGPVDCQIHWPVGSNYRHASTSDLQAFLDFIKEQGLSSGEARQKLPGWLVTGSDAPAIGSIYRILRENRRIISQLLGSRRKPLSRGANNKIAEFLLNGIGIHAQSIRRTEARKAGLSFISDLENSGIEKEVMQLYAAYFDILNFGVPFANPSTLLDHIRREGDEFDYDAYGRHISETPIAIVESLHDTNPAYVAYGLRHWNEAPPVPPVYPGIQDEDHGPARADGAHASHRASRGLWFSVRNARAVEGPLGPSRPK